MSRGMSNQDRMKNRTTFYPAYYRVRITTAAGPMFRDFKNVEAAKREAARTRGVVEACWYVKGAYTMDIEVVP
jgi:hypothetical protein